MRLPTGHLATLLLLSGVAIAHLGHDIAQEAAERLEFLNSVERSSLAHCAEKLKARGVVERNVARRSAQVPKAQDERKLKKRIEAGLTVSHNQTGKGYAWHTDAATLFAGYNSCLLNPDTVEGPYYVSGERIRKNIVERQRGVHALLEYQVIDVNTCDPVPDVYVEIWHCNATGVYSGVIAGANGNPSDESNVDTTWLRGIQRTDCDGVAHFHSIFPGHYTSRATHIHLVVHTNVTLFPNNTLGSENYASHIGHAFFDQDLITEVEKLEPYRRNTLVLTENVDDIIISQDPATNGVIRFMEYTFIGDHVSDGLLAWIALGVNTTRSRPVTPAVRLYDSGGVPNADAPGAPGVSAPSSITTSG
ncbi:hypothetical protein ACJ41O_009176 [Fusarium nematophilum]